MPIPFLYSSILIGIFCTSLTFQDRTPSPLPSPACFFLSVGSVSQRKVASGRAAAEEGWLLLGLRETALLRQGLLSEPQASSGPAAMLLAVSRSPSSIPRRSPCPERCHLPLASLNHIHLSKPQKHPRLHPLPERCLLPLASLYTSASQNPNNIHPGPMPPSSSVPLYLQQNKKAPVSSKYNTARHQSKKKSTGIWTEGRSLWPGPDPKRHHRARRTRHEPRNLPSETGRGRSACRFFGNGNWWCCKCDS